MFYNFIDFNCTMFAKGSKITFLTLIILILTLKLSYLEEKLKMGNLRNFVEQGWCMKSVIHATFDEESLLSPSNRSLPHCSGEEINFPTVIYGFLSTSVSR